MPEQFRFERTNAFVMAGLTPQQINEVREWQNPLTDFQFEFHTMHEAGWPCYLREPDGPNRGLPKINLLDYNGQMLQQGAVRTQANRTEFERVLAANTEAFRILARRFYEGVEVAPRTGQAGWYVQFQCNKSRQQPPVFVRLPERGQSVGAVFWSNMARTAEKPVCAQHRNSLCMIPTAVQLNGQQALGKTKRFDEGHQIVG